MDRGAWWATVYGVAKSCMWLSNFHILKMGNRDLERLKGLAISEQGKELGFSSKFDSKSSWSETSLVVQWLRLWAPHVLGTGLIVGDLRSHTPCNQKTKPKQNIKQKQHCSKFHKDFKNCPHCTATKPMCHNCWVWHNSWNPRTLEAVLCNKRSHRNEKPQHGSQE